MAKHIRLRCSDVEKLSALGKALSSPVRIQMLQILETEKLSIAELARRMQIPASSAALDIRTLQKANLVKIEEKPGSRGSAKFCVRDADMISIRMVGMAADVNNTVSVEMPIGAYTSCEVSSVCGIADENGILGMDDMELAFYMPERLSAQILWSTKGYVEYTFPNRLKAMPYPCVPRSLIVSAELCSETSGYREDWKSDITLWINGVECGTWTSPGDFGQRRGKLTPVTWSSGRTQYGLLTSWEIRRDGCYINKEWASSVNLDDLRLMEASTVFVRIGNKEDAVYAGGFNIFGKKFGDYEQDIIMSITYDEVVQGK
ncbi:MAG: helix-turn-helix domain-containing protein [Eubacteriales bacterium]|nr:helix-turn-helix domain-containing protein [Eubacteriales bacterium]